MKFYYNNVLVRTSKTHVYTHAVMTKDGKLVGCRTGKEAAEGIITSEINGAERELENLNRALKAMQNGEKKYLYKEARRSCYITFQQGRTVAYYEEAIEDMNKWIANVRENWMVVELEARD